MFLPYFLRGTAIGLTAAASPGPLQAFTINQSLTQGWRNAAPLALVPLLGDIPIVLTILFLLDRLPDKFLSILSIAGGVFVLYLAWGYWRTWKTRSNLQNISPENTPGGFRKGLLMNLLSPGPYTFWALVNGPIVIAAFRQSPLYGIAFVTGFYLILISGFLAIILIFHQARRFGPGFVHGMLLVSTLILAGFGLFLISDGIQQLLV